MADNEKITKNLFYYMERHLFGADSDNGEELLDRGQFGVTMSPGQFLSPNWRETEGSTDMYNQWEFLDEALDTSFTYRPLITTVSGQYWNALDRVSIRHRPLTPAEKTELASIDQEIDSLRPTYEVYLRRFEDAELAYEFERAKQNPNNARLQQLLRAKNQARRLWESLGRRRYFEDLIARSWQIQTGNPAASWLELRDDFQNATNLAPPLGQYQTTLLNPPISAWNNAGWATFSKTISDTEVHNYSKSVTWSGSIGANWGLFNSVRVGANGEKTVIHNTSDVTTIDVTFEYLRCRIVRPWLKRDLFANKDWTWKQPNTFVYLSDGGNLAQSPPVRPIGTLPFLHTSLIVVRNVIIRADFSSTDVQEMHSRISGSVSAGFGCFSVRGSYSETTNQVDIRATFDGTELRIPHPQVIGYLGVLLPKSPDPDKSQSYWGPDAVFPEDSSTADRKALKGARDFDYRINQAEREYEVISRNIDEEYAALKEKTRKKIAEKYELNDPPVFKYGGKENENGDSKAKSDQGPST